MVIIGDRLTLVKSILEAILVSWHSPAYLPEGTLEKIKGKDNSVSYEKGIKKRGKDI